jgi:hypothetical protein
VRGLGMASNDCEHHSTEIFSDTLENRESLTEKVISGDLLTDSEKDFLCNLLNTNFPKIKRRGAPSKAVRDRMIAYNFEIMKDQGMATKEIIDELAKKFCLHMGCDFNESTFYRSLKRGRPMLPSFKLFLKIRQIRKNRKNEG